MPEPTSDHRGDQLAESILEAPRGLRFGSVEIVVYEAKVVQTVRTEKVRYANDLGGPTRAK